MQPDQLSALEARLGYSFKNKALLQRAISHRSAVKDSESYERLEFLGDRVLGLVLAERLYLSYERANQGELTKRFHAQAQQSALATFARKLELQAFVVTEKGSQLNERDSVLSDIVEAIIAAIYLDAGPGEGMAAAARLILSHLDWQAPLIDQQGNPKSALQEYSDGRGLGLPVYEEIDRSGPEHALQFTVRVSLTTGVEAVGSGKNKKAAEFSAAQNLLKILTSKQP